MGRNVHQVQATLIYDTDISKFNGQDLSTLIGFLYSLFVFGISLKYVQLSYVISEHAIYKSFAVQFTAHVFTANHM